MAKFYFLCFYSPLAFDGLQSAAFLRNWMKFVCLMHFLDAGFIHVDQLSLVKKQMPSLREYDALYGKKNITYNAHIQLHLVDRARSCATWRGHCAKILSRNEHTHRGTNSSLHPKKTSSHTAQDHDLRQENESCQQCGFPLCRFTKRDYLTSSNHRWP